MYITEHLHTHADTQAQCLHCLHVCICIYGGAGVQLRCRCVRVYICARSIRKIARGRCTAPCEKHRGTASWQLRPRVTLLFLCVTAWFAAHKGGLDASSRPAQVDTKALATISALDYRCPRPRSASAGEGSAGGDGDFSREKRWQVKLRYRYLSLFFKDG